jgi:hypothetical protein
VLPLLGQRKDAAAQGRHGPCEGKGQQVRPNGGVIKKQNVHDFLAIG